MQKTGLGLPLLTFINVTLSCICVTKLHQFMHTFTAAVSVLGPLAPDTTTTTTAAFPANISAPPPLKKTR
jgi:hypothetical protein